MRIALKYGAGEVAFDLDERRVIEIAEPRPMPPIEDVQGALAKAMVNPLGPALSDVVKEGDRVLLLTVDFTRPSPRKLMGPVINAIKSQGAEVDVMIGLGNHRPMTDKELVNFIGTANVLQNDPKGAMWKLGTTSFGTPVEVDHRLRDYDIRIAIGFVEPSYLLGFTGGRKILMPGVASSRAIARNHFLLLSPGRKLGLLHGNPLSNDALEFARAVGLHWIVDVVLNPDDSYAAIHCGDMEKANEAACADSTKIYEHTFPLKADIVIVSCGGHPYDFDLVQTKKGLVPAMECVREGGAIIMIGQCPDGWGGEGPVSKQALMEQRPEEILADLRRRFEAGDCPWELAPCSCRYLLSRAVAEMGCQVIAVTDINDELAETFIDVAPSVSDALAMAEERVGKNAGVIVIPDGRRIIPVTEA
ncbi:MAG: nickel-dependent lactate racemase [Planctomycetota bacterium]